MKLIKLTIKGNTLQLNYNLLPILCPKTSLQLKPKCIEASTSIAA